tara:strand:- start:1282 stop:2484 length:1203 start_codon:yes stop_codon:yes gene_type:complete
MKIEINKTLISITFILLIFRTTLSILGSFLAYFPLAIGAMIIIKNYMLSVLNQSKKSFILILSLIIYITFLIFCYPLLSTYSGFFIPILGALQYLFPILFWSSFFLLNKEKADDYFSFFTKIFCNLAVFVAIFAYIQYFFSNNLFGLIVSDVYAPIDGEVNINVTKRAISFISSPQSLGLFLASAFCIQVACFKNSFLNAMKLFLILGAGVLTGSKAFIIFILVFLALNAFRFFPRFFLMLPILLIGFYFLFPYIDIDTLERYGYIITRILLISEYNTFQIWMSYLQYPTNFFQFLFGHGLGLAGEASQSFYNYKILTGSTESFLIQLYFETGFFLTLAFIIFYLICVLKCFFTYEIKPLGSILIASFFVIIGTPAFFGFVNSFWLWSILIYVACWKRDE